MRKRFFLLTILLFTILISFIQAEIYSEEDIYGTFVTNITHITIQQTNSSEYWDDMNTINTTQMENNNGVLNILETWLESLFDNLFSGKTTDDLTEGSTNLYDNKTWNESLARDLFLENRTIAWNRSNSTVILHHINDRVEIGNIPMPLGILDISAGEERSNSSHVIIHSNGVGGTTFTSLFQDRHYIGFDTYRENGTRRSWDNGSNFEIRKTNDAFRIFYSSGIPVGERIPSMELGFYMNSSGAIGIGTNTPSRLFEVNGDTNFRGNLFFDDDIQVIDHRTDNDRVYFCAGCNYSVFPTDVLIGDGDIVPEAKLHVNASTENEVAIFQSDNGSAWIVVEDDSGYSWFWTEGNTTKIAQGGIANFVIEHVSGKEPNVGIGIEDPTKMLHISDEGTTSNSQVLIQTDEEGGLSTTHITSDNMSIGFGMKYEDDAYKSLDSGSNFMINKESDLLKFMYDSGVAEDDNVSMNDGLVMDTSGNVNVTNNITASWFKGLFNWMVGDDWNEFNGSTLLFNESKLSTEYFNASSIQVITGTPQGVLGDIQTYNNIPYNVSEVASDLELRVNFTNITDFNQLIVRYKSDEEDEPHTLIVQIYEPDESVWEDYGTLVGNSVYQVVEFGVFDSDEHIDAEDTVQVRFYQDEGVPQKTHKHQFDWVTISKGFGTPSGQEIDPLSYHKDENIDASNFNISADLGTFNNLNVTGTSYLGDITIDTDNITVNNIISKDGNISFWNGTDRKMIITEDGKVGIGTDNPLGLLQVGDNNMDNQFLVFQTTNTGDTGISYRLSDESERGYMFWDSAEDLLLKGDAIRLSTQNNDNQVILSNNLFEIVPQTKITSDKLQFSELRGLVYNSTTDTIGFSMDGNMNKTLTGSVMVVDASGNVGIGTTTPLDKLMVNGSFRVQNSSGTLALYVNDSNGFVGIGTSSPKTNLDTAGYIRSIGPSTTAPTGGSGVEFVFDSTNAKGYLYTYNRSGGYYFPTRIDGSVLELNYLSGGNVGIGKLNPTYMLEVNGNVSLNDSLYVLDNGKVGIGTSSPSKSLHLYSNSTNGKMLSESQQPGVILKEIDGNANENWWIDNNFGKLRFLTVDDDLASNFSNIMTIQQNGYVGIGTTTPTQFFEVKTNLANKWAGIFHNDGNNVNRFGVIFQVGTDNNAGTNYHTWFNDGDGSAVGSISSSGGTVSYNPFTGSHLASIPEIKNDVDKLSWEEVDYGNYKYGTVMCIDSTSTNPETPHKVDYNVTPCNKSYDSSVFGVYSSKHENINATEDNVHGIYALGDGHILVTEEGGNISIGDYLTSSAMEGHAMKQDDDILHSYTVAKATHSVDWSKEILNTKLISCTYHAS